MTIITSCNRWNMGTTLACGNHTIVAGLTRAIDLRVIHHRYRCPGGAVMTGFANISCVDVSGRFARGNHALMTG